MPTVKNTNNVLFTTAALTLVNTDATHITTWDAASGGNYIHQQSLSNDPSPLQLGQRYEIAAEKLSLRRTRPRMRATKARSGRSGGRTKGGLWVQLHSAAPGAYGTDNVIAGIPRVQVPEAGWTDPA